MCRCSNNTAKSVYTRTAVVYVRRLSNRRTGARRFAIGRAGQYFSFRALSIIIQIDNANYYKNGRVHPTFISYSLY